MSNTIKGTVATTKTIKGSVYGIYGKDGLSAYELAVKNGFVGTEQEWIASLKGKQGERGEQGIQGIKGDKGEKGDKGDTGNSGVYLGSGEMPEDCNVQIDPTGEPYDMNTYATKDELAEAVAQSKVFFDITENGIISLKAEYRGLSTSSNTPSYSVSDNGVGKAGSLNYLLPELLVIPDKVGDITVTKLADGMFCRNNTVKNIVLPSGITEIPNLCFWRTENLRLLDYTTNNVKITKVGEKAFLRSKIKKLELPYLTEAGEEAFRWMTELEYIDIGNLKTLPAKCFEQDTSLNTIYGGNDITVIPEMCFYVNLNLQNVSFLSSLTSIGNYAFKQCSLDGDWEALASNGCTFGTWATSKQTNVKDYWSSYEVPKTVINPLPITFNQHYSLWANKNIGSSLQPNKNFDDGCVFFASMVAFCGLNSRYDLTTAFDLQTECRRFNALSDFTGDLSQVDTFLTKLGFAFNKYIVNNESEGNVLEAIYNTLLNGGYVLLNIPSSNTEVAGHIVLCYGIEKDTQKLYIADSECFRKGTENSDVPTGFIYASHIKNLIQTTGNNLTKVITLTKAKADETEEVN